MRRASGDSPASIRKRGFAGATAGGGRSCSARRATWRDSASMARPKASDCGETAASLSGRLSVSTGSGVTTRPSPSALTRVRVSGPTTMRAPRFCAFASAVRSWPKLSSISSSWIARFAFATLCAAKKPSRTASAARANGVLWLGRINATGTGAPPASFSADFCGGASGAGAGVAGAGEGTGVAVAGGAGSAGADGVTGAGGALGATFAAGGGAGARCAGTFAGGVAQEHNAAARSAIRNRDCRRMKEDLKADRLVEASGVAAQELAAGALYVVATPIGNLADLTVRAWWVLSHVDAIAAEDTRVTRHLLDRYRIDVAPSRLIAAHEHNERAAAERMLALLREGARVALVSDAGTPGISDPGARIVREVRAAGLPVIPVPGASSLAAALSVAGFDHGAALFVGFLPGAARDRARCLQTIATSDAAIVLFEAPHRLSETAAALAAVLAPIRRIVIARELTKRFETIDVVEAAELVSYVEANEPRGEYVLVIEPAADEPAAIELDAVARRWLAAMADELPPARAAAVAAQATGLPRDALYRELIRARAPGKDDSGAD